jgi:hypothetical protein
MKPPSWIVVAGERSARVDIVVDGFFSRVFSFEDKPQGRHNNEIGDQIPESESMAQVVEWGRLGSVKLCAQDGSKISDAVVHGLANLRE